MGCDIFTRKAGKLIFHNKIQQSGINFIRLHTSGGSNQSTNKIIVIGVGKVTQFGILLSHRDKASNPTHKHTKSKRRRRMEERRRKRQIFSKIVLEVGARETRGKWRIM